MMYNRTNHDFVPYPFGLHFFFQLDGHARSSRNDDTQKSFSDSPFLSLSLSLSNSASVFSFGGDELLFKWTLRILPPYLDSRASERTKRWRNERERVAGSLSNQTEGGRPTGSSGATVPVACRARLLGL